MYSTVDGDIVKSMVATVRVAVDASVVLATEDVYATDVEDVYAIDAEESREQEVRCGILLETKDLSVETGLRENGQGDKSSVVCFSDQTMEQPCIASWNKQMQMNVWQLIISRQESLIKIGNILDLV